MLSYVKDNWPFIAIVVGICTTMGTVFTLVGISEMKEAKKVNDLNLEIKGTALADGYNQCIVEIDGKDYRAFSKNTGVCINEVGDDVVVSYSGRYGVVYIKDDGK